MTLKGYEHKKDGVNVPKFLKPFKGVFKGVAYDSPSLPREVLKIILRVNNFWALFWIPLCNAFNLELFVFGEGLVRLHPHG